MTKELTVKQEPEKDGFLQMMERLALSDIDVAKLEKMMDLQERMLDRNAKMSFASALASMQMDMPVITQNGEIRHNDKLISRYAKFEDINEVVKPVLEKYGFAISFRVKQPDSKIEVTAILSHRDGHTEETTMLLPADTGGAKNAVQAQGSSVSYGKRYTMCALLNITSRGEDDDGSSFGVIGQGQVDEIEKLIADTKTDKKAFLAYFKVKDVRSIDSKDYDKVMAMLNKKVKK